METRASVQVRIVLVLSFLWLVHAMRSTGRVYLLSFYGEKRFFWMQEPKPDKDAECACFARGSRINVLTIFSDYVRT
jgi:hypothetical protein